MSAEASLETHVDDYHRQLEFYAIEKISQWLSYWQYSLYIILK